MFSVLILKYLTHLFIERKNSGIQGNQEELGALRLGKFSRATQEPGLSQKPEAIASQPSLHLISPLKTTRSFKHLMEPLLFSASGLKTNKIHFLI